MDRRLSTIQPMQRRKFIQQSSTLSLGLAAIPNERILPSFQENKERKFKMCLAPGKIGVSVSQRETLQLAHKFGFESIIAYPDQLAKMSSTEMSELLGEMKEKGISWGTSGLPIEFRKDQATFQKGLDSLPKAAEALEKAGVNGMGTWILPMHPSLSYRENFAHTSKRLKKVATILGHYGVRLGPGVRRPQNHDGQT